MEGHKEIERPQINKKEKKEKNENKGDFKRKSENKQKKKRKKIKRNISPKLSCLNLTLLMSIQHPVGMHP